MRICVKTDGKTIRIPIPTALVCNRLAAQIGGKAIEKHVSPEVCPLTGEQLNRLMKEIRRVSKLHKGMNLVEVDEPDGTSVRITL